jgi:ATP-dependent DNA ligase
MPRLEWRALHIRERGIGLFRAACERDLEGVVAKWTKGAYRTDGRLTSWLTIKNPEYTQMIDRHELFESRPRIKTPGLRRAAPELRLA